jgi:hypothetical protein
MQTPGNSEIGEAFVKDSEQYKASCCDKDAAAFDFGSRKTDINVLEENATRFIKPKDKFYPTKLYIKKIGPIKQAAKKKHIKTTQDGVTGFVVPNLDAEELPWDVENSVAHTTQKKRKIAEVEADIDESIGAADRIFNSAARKRILRREDSNVSAASGATNTKDNGNRKKVKAKGKPKSVPKACPTPKAAAGRPPKEPRLRTYVFCAGVIWSFQIQRFL